MKKFLLFCSTLLATLVVSAAHITGGEMYYTLESVSGNNYTYRVTLKLYRDCFSSGAQLDPTVPISIFRNDAARTRVWTSTITQSSVAKQNLSAPSPCIQNPPAVCYDVGFYTFSVTLAGTAEGYTITYQRCCRIAGINNLINSSAAGATYTAKIPGTNSAADAPANNSARFVGVDTVITCANNAFCYNFGATDPDRDSLSYIFCNAYLGGSQAAPVPDPPSAPISSAGDYATVSYASPYSATQPLGAGVTLNPLTGMMCGVAPPAGIYVVTVCVNEYRKGVLIATQRKDLQIKVGDCNVAKALPAVFDIKGIKVLPGVAGCKSFTYDFANDAPPNPLIKTYYWEFSDGATYTVANPKHTFADTGVYTIKLVINRGQDCTDSQTTTLKIYPGFFPGFTNSGVCVNKPISFIDTSKAIYGSLNFWRWDFGEATVTDDTSRLRNPTYVYPLAGKKDVVFVVKNSVGCVDTVRQQIEILTRPPLSVAFKDTLICNGDSVQLHAVGSGVFTWTPTTRLLNAGTADPTAFPNVTTKYIVQLDDQGCLANDTVQVRVVNFVSLQVMPDTTVCVGDSLRLQATTDGLRYLWNNASTLNNPTVLNPIAKPVNNPTTYSITSYIGPKCFTTASVIVRLTPYATINAGDDTTICYNTTAQLRGTTDGAFLSWMPTTGLNNPTSLVTDARLRSTTRYVLSATNLVGCVSRDTVTVKVNPEVIAFAGRDTAVVIGQTLQFTASGGINYEWSPPVALNNTKIYNPKAVYDGSFDSVRYFLTVSDSTGCTDDATVLVKIFRSNPKIFVPTAFTPNGDGRNEFVAPVAVGITRIDYFRVYNRWGQLVFETTVNGKGWDGKIAGQPQATATFVWIVKGTDYLGKTVFDKGTVTLIR